MTIGLILIIYLQINYLTEITLSQFIVTGGAIFQLVLIPEEN
jgi:hypothetical protein